MNISTLMITRTSRKLVEKGLKKRKKNLLLLFAIIFVLLCGVAAGIVFGVVL